LVGFVQYLLWAEASKALMTSDYGSMVFELEQASKRASQQIAEGRYFHPSQIEFLASEGVTVVSSTLTPTPAAQILANEARARFAAAVAARANPRPRLDTTAPNGPTM
jgi:hypothetical protein